MERRRYKWEGSIFSRSAPTLDAQADWHELISRDITKATLVTGDATSKLNALAETVVQLRDIGAWYLDAEIILRDELARAILSLVKANVSSHRINSCFEPIGTDRYNYHRSIGTASLRCIGPGLILRDTESVT